MEIKTQDIREEIFRLKGNRDLATRRKLSEAVAWLNGAIESLSKVIRGDFS